MISAYGNERIFFCLRGSFAFVHCYSFSWIHAVEIQRALLYSQLTISYPFNLVFCLISDSDIKDAHALYDFQGRTERELSFKKGDSLILFEKVSSDWWEGAVADREGLIPDKYIQMGPRSVNPTELIEHCCSVLAGLPLGFIGCIDRVLQSAARLISHFPKYASVFTYMRDVPHYLPGSQRIS